MTFMEPPSASDARLIWRQEMFFVKDLEEVPIDMFLKKRRFWTCTEQQIEQTKYLTKNIG